MQGTFHRLRVQLFCYATEDEERLHEMMAELLDDEEFDIDICDGEHGNRLIIMQSELRKQNEFKALFSKLGPKLAESLIKDIDNRIDDDCTFYLRIDKQKALEGVYRMVHHGDVIAITGKVASHPARKEIATKNLLEFLEDFITVPEEPREE